MRHFNLLLLTKIFIYLLYFGNASKEIQLNNVLELTDNFFMNLNMFVKDKGAILDQEIIDIQIEDYLKLVKQTYGLSSSGKNKRSVLSGAADILTKDFIGVYVLNGFTKQPRIPVQHPKAMVLFKHEFGNAEIWYSAALLTNKNNSKIGYLVIYRYDKGQYKEVNHTPITNALKLTSHTEDGLTFIAVAETLDEIPTGQTGGTAIYLFDTEENLYKMQTFNITSPTDIILWKNMDDIFLAISHQTVINKQVNCEDKTIIYKLMDEQFQLVQYINGYCTKKIVPFHIADIHFLAVANYKNNKDETDIYSEIFIYDIHDGIFVSYQKIFTHGAVDIKYFCFKQNNIQETFLVVANLFELNQDGSKNYQTNSIVYKFVDDYFMPFQSFALIGAENWLPVVGPNGEFILIVSCKYGVRLFQYDGWRFVESNIQYTSGALSYGITAMSSYIYDSHPIIVISNRNDQGDMDNVFTPVFTYQDVMNDLQNDLLEWCKDVLIEVDNTDLEDLSHLVDTAPKVTDDVIYLREHVTLYNATIENLVTDDDTIPEQNIDKILHLGKQIDKRSEKLRTLENFKGPITLHGDVIVKNLNIKIAHELTFDNLNAEYINGENMQLFFNNIIYLDQPYSIPDHYEFETVILDNSFTVENLNNIPMADYIQKSIDTDLATGLIVEGNVIVKDLVVKGLVDGIDIAEHNILLIEGDQYLAGSISVTDLKTDELQVDSINFIDVRNLNEYNINFNIYDKKIDSLSIRNLSIGLINKVDINILEKFALVNNGDQIIEGNFAFDNLDADDFDVEYLSGKKIPDDLILTSGGTYFLNQDLMFTQDINTNHLHVITRLNQIPVFRGKLDVLVNNSRNIQYISGEKQFDSLHLIGPINLRGRIQLEGIDRLSPIIEKNLTLIGDYRINGEIRVEDVFKFNDISDTSGTYSLSRLDEFGLKLTDTEIPLQLELQQELNVENINVGRVNNIAVNSWIKINDEPKVITGRKIFENRVDISGESCVVAINGVDLEDLYENMLKINGNQTITGQHTYAKVTAVRVFGDRTTLDNIPWDEVMTVNEAQYINGTTTFKNTVDISNFEAIAIDLHSGQYMGYNFNDMIADTVLINTTSQITGLKHFAENLNFVTLNMTRVNEFRIDRFLHELEKWSGDFVNISGPIKIKKTVPITNILFEQFNGITKEQFGRNWLLKHGDQTITGDLSFHDVSFKKNVITHDNLVNGINLLEIQERAVKIDREYTFEKIYFENGVESLDSVILSGKINHLELEDVVLSNGMDQFISGTKQIFNNFTVNGYLYVNGLLAGYNLTVMDEFVYPTNNKQMRNLIIEGNLILSGEANVKYLNDYDIDEISKETWFTNRETSFRGFITFGNVKFHDQVTVVGYVDDVNLVWLSNNYFSKTKNQTITAQLEFTDGIICDNNLVAENAIVLGLAGGIDFTNFDTSILQHKDQSFDLNMAFERVIIKDEFDCITVKELNLSTDVMRYDVIKNIISAEKALTNLNVNFLQMPHDKNVQNVNIEQWFENAIYLNVSSHITGLKTFTNATFLSNIDLEGPLNSHLFIEERILTKNTKQNINGKKTFTKPVQMNEVKLKGQLNDIKFDEFIKNQIDLTKDVVFDSNLIIHKPLTAENIYFEQLCQGIDVPKMLEDIENLDKVNSYVEPYEKLLNFSKLMHSSLKNQAYYLSAYKEIQVLPRGTKYAISLGENKIAFIDNASFEAIISIFIYNKETSQFEFDSDDIRIETLNEITYISPIYLRNQWYLYIEESNPESEFTHISNMYEILDGTEMPNNILTNGTASIASVQIQNKNCITTVHPKHNCVNVNCEGEDNKFELYQQLNITNGIKVISKLIENHSYLFIISNGAGLYESYTEIWKLNEHKNMFELSQKLHTINPNAFDIIKYKNNIYLAIASKHTLDIINLTPIQIFKYNKNMKTFEEFNKLKIQAPIDVKFNVLTTNELALYITTENPTEPLLIYKYEGIAGFKQKINAITLPTVDAIQQFHIDNTNFIVVSNNRETRIIKALYTGVKH